MALDGKVSHVEFLSILQVGMTGNQNTKGNRVVRVGVL